ncbi:MAG: hypothetical protein QOG91_305 [Candidatus Parcubacteria bacterium]|nr:hypothetical protein [Candidatus Parcubacteria bacterium]
MKKIALPCAATLGGLIIISLAVIVFFSIAPSKFPSDKIVSIPKDMYMSQAADALYASGVIKSPFLYKIFVVLMSGHRQVQAGEYLFDRPESVVRVAYRTLYGLEGIAKIKVTLFEGMTAAEMGTTLKAALPALDAKKFVALAKPLEGSLFPDTYYFHANAKPQEIVDLLHGTFEAKIKTVQGRMSRFGKSATDVIAMASLVEKEATKTADRRIIAGILWRRLAKKMPLQVDATFYYLLGKESAKLTVTDLAMDSPYNLYKHTGLPPGPINNPGLDAIVDTISPTATDYLYFLSGKDGVTHYAATFEGHIANKDKFLE